VKSRLLLKYLAARSASRRYAFNIHSRDLEILLLFRAILHKERFSLSNAVSFQEEAVDNLEHLPVWVALFDDAVVIMSERSGGAKAEFLHLIDSNLRVKGVSPEGQGDYSAERSLELISTAETRFSGKYLLSSDTPAALVVFEKKLSSLLSPFAGRAGVRDSWSINVS
jgi:hypothetical protein